MFGIGRVSLLWRRNLRACSHMSSVAVASSSSGATKHRFLDVTGNPLTAASNNALTVIDESILQLIMHTNDSAVSLRKAWNASQHDIGGMVPTLLVWQLLRQPRIVEDDEVTTCFVTLEKLLSEGKLNEREAFIASAALAFSEGKYYRAAALLETNMLANNQDLLSLKLTQDCYLAAGDSHNVLGCVARWMPLFDERHAMYGNVMGLFAVGLIEVGRLAEAEEMAHRAVTRTKGDDVWALHALLNTYQLLGRSSEVMAVLGDHLPRHGNESAVGQQLLLYNKGSALVQRGNYSGALRVHDDMLYNMMAASTEIKTLSFSQYKPQSGRLVGPATNATLLLWQIALHSSSPSVDERWTFPHAVSNMWAAESSEPTAVEGQSQRSGSPRPCDAMSAVGQAMAHAAATQAKTNTSSSSSSSSQNDDHSIDSQYGGGRGEMSGVEKASDSAVMAAVESNSKAIWEWFRHINNPNLAAKYPADNPAGVPNQDGTTTELPADAVDADHEGFLQLLLKSCDDRPSISTSTASSLYPKLSSISPSIFAVKGMPSPGPSSSGSDASSDVTSLSDRDWAVTTVGSSTCHAIAAFARHDYASAVELFRSRGQEQRLIGKLGGTAVQRDVIEQTIIEALLRSGRLQEAQLALCERTTLVPNDAQSWRRLASVFGRNGLHFQAKTAHYTAWQLGIGQGGFGGPT